VEPADRHLSPADLLASPEGGEWDRLERHAAACPACAALLAREAQTLAWLAEDLRPVQPPAQVWDRIARSTAPAAAPLWERLAARFAAQVAALADLAEAQARALFAQWDDAAAWSEASPGVSIFHFEGGPATAGAITGFVRIEAGSAFPAHRHLGREWNLVLTGALVLPGGLLARAGEVVEMEPGSSHALGATAEEAVVYLAVALEGIAIDDVPLDAADPRA
jgi:putative transcriptional regulator